MRLASQPPCKMTCFIVLTGAIRFNTIQFGMSRRAERLRFFIATQVSRALNRKFGRPKTSNGNDLRVTKRKIWVVSTQETELFWLENSHRAAFKGINGAVSRSNVTILALTPIRSDSSSTSPKEEY